MRQYRLPALAERLYLMLIADAGLRTCGLAELTRAYQEASGCATGKTKITVALETLEEVGLVTCVWRAHGSARLLTGVSLLLSLKSAEACPARTRGGRE
jgi:hypothetical protein